MQQRGANAFWCQWRALLDLQENLLIDEDHNLKLIDFGLCAKPKVKHQLSPSHCVISECQVKGKRGGYNVRSVWLFPHKMCKWVSLS